MDALVKFSLIPQFDLVASFRCAIRSGHIETHAQVTHYVEIQFKEVPCYASVQIV